MTFACRQSSGTVPSWRYVLNMMDRIGTSSEAQSFRMREGMQSEPVAFLGWSSVGASECHPHQLDFFHIRVWDGYLVGVFLDEGRLILAIPDVSLVLGSTEETVIVF